MKNTETLNYKSAEEWRAEASKHIQDREDSFDRCDTDGFVSQWASGLNSSLKQTLAELAENGYMASFKGLYDRETGKRVAAKIIYCENKFAPWNGKVATWATLDPETGKFTGRFFPAFKNNSTRSKLYAAGLEERDEMASAYAKLDGTGKGLSGNVWVSTYRTDGGYPKDVELVVLTK